MPRKQCSRRPVSPNHRRSSVGVLPLLRATRRIGKHMTEIGRLCDAFLPTELLGRIHGAHGDRPAATEFPAAVLFADVSRYTALVERLAQRGQGGLEKIAHRLSDSYD